VDVAIASADDPDTLSIGSTADARHLRRRSPGYVACPTTCSTWSATQRRRRPALGAATRQAVGPCHRRQWTGPRLAPGQLPGARWRAMRSASRGGASRAAVSIAWSRAPPTTWRPRAH